MLELIAIACPVARIARGLGLGCLRYVAIPCVVIAVVLTVGCTGSKSDSTSSGTLKASGMPSGGSAAGRGPIAGHTGSVYSVSFSPDGKSLLTASADETAKLWDLAEHRAYGSINGGGGAIYSAAFSPGGALIATGGKNKTVRLWNTSNLQLIGTLPAHDDAAAAVAFTADGKLLASASRDATVKLWDTNTRTELRSLDTGLAITMAFAPNGAMLAAAGDDGSVRLWDTFSGQPKATLQGHTKAIYGVAFFPDGTKLASASLDKTVIVWDTSSGKLLQTLQSPGESLCVTVSPDGKRIAAGTGNRQAAQPQPGIVVVWDAGNGRQLTTLAAHLGSIRSVAFSRDSKTLASASEDKSVRLWDVGTLQLAATLRGENVPGQPAFMGHLSSVNAVSRSPDGKLVATACDDGTVKVWNAATRDEVYNLQAHAQSARAVAFSPDSRTIATGGVEPEGKLWDASTGEFQGSLTGHSGEIRSLAYAPDGKTLVSASGDGTVRIWDANDRRPLITLPQQNGPVHCVAFSSDSRLVATAAGSEIHVWNTDDGSECRALTGHDQAVQQLQFSLDGSTLAGAGQGGNVFLWDITTGAARTLAGHVGSVRSVAFLRGGSTLATAGDDRAIRVWDITSGQLQYSLLKRHLTPITGLTAESHADTLASVSADRELKLWDVGPVSPQDQFRGHAGRIWRIVSSPDGRTLATGSTDNTVRLWDIATGRQLAKLDHAHSIRELRFSPTDPVLAVTSFNVTTSDSELKLWDLRTGDEIPSTQSVPMPCTGLAFSHDGRSIATGHTGARILIWEYPSMRLKKEVSAGSGVVIGLDFSPDGKLLASAGTDRTVRLWNVESWESRGVLTGHTRPVNFVRFSPDGSLLASGGEDRLVRLWNPQDGSELALLSGLSAGVTSMVFSPDGSRVAASCSERTIYLWDTRTHEASSLDMPRTTEIVMDGIGFMPQGDRLLWGRSSELTISDVRSGSDQLTRRLPKKGNEKFTLKGHTDIVRGVRFSPDGRTLASRSDDRTVRLWDTTDYQLRATLSDGQRTIGAIAFSPDSTKLAMSAGSNISLWDVVSGSKLASLGSHDGQNVNFVAFSPDGAILGSGSGTGQNQFNRPGEVRLWDVASQRELMTLPKQPGSCDFLMFSSDSKNILTRQWRWTDDFSRNVVENRLWDVNSGKQLDHLRLSSDSEALLLPNARLVEIKDNVLIFHDVATGGKLREISLSNGLRTTRILSADRNTLAIVGGGAKQLNPVNSVSAVLIVDCVNLSSRIVQPDHPVIFLAISYDGKSLAAPFFDETTVHDMVNRKYLSENLMAVWDTQSGKLVSILRGHSDEIKNVTFSPDGSTIASGSADNTVKLWSAR